MPSYYYEGNMITWSAEQNDFKKVERRERYELKQLETDWPFAFHKVGAFSETGAYTESPEEWSIYDTKDSFWWRALIGGKKFKTANDTEITKHLDGTLTFKAPGKNGKKIKTGKLRRVYLDADQR